MAAHFCPAPDAPGGPGNVAGRLNPKLGQAVATGEWQRPMIKLNRRQMLQGSTALARAPL
jgi:hypothetical protein